MAVTTYEAVINKIRELSFDRFITPTFFISHRTLNPLWTIAVSSTAVTITDNTPISPAVPIAHIFLFTNYLTLDDLLTGILTVLSSNIDVKYSGSFIPTEPSSSLMIQGVVTLDKPQPLFRRYYFSEAYMKQFFNEYAYMKLGASHAQVDALVWEDELESADFTNDQQEHFALWIAYQLVHKRRLYELAGQQVQQSFADGSSFSTFSMQVPGEKVEVRIGDVFTMSEDSGNSLGVSNGGDIPSGMLAPWMVGTDNELMDYYSFWYRLQLWLRNRIEFLFADQSLRLDTVVTGQMKLDKYSASHYYSYFESYPWAWAHPVRGHHRRPG